MIVKRIESERLAHNSYFIGSDNEAAVIDPRRDCDVYIDLARQNDLKIKYIFETHRNEDYVIGSTELRNITLAKIYHGPGLDWKYGEILSDGQEFQIGSLKLTAIHTPGHTDESISYMLVDLSSDNIIMVFTGDTLFVDDVGRVDLYGPDEAPRLASNLYDSVFNKILPLGDNVILRPGHGAGSVCGTHIGDREESTLGDERTNNPVLKIENKEDFIKYKLAERPERPYYFDRMEIYNLEGPPILGHLPFPTPLAPNEFQEELDRGAIVIDTSNPATYGGAHIKGSYSIWLDGIPSFAGWVLPYDTPILLVLDDQSHFERAVRYLVRLGYDNIQGCLGGSIESWYNSGFPIEHLSLLSVREVKAKLESKEILTILDVRSREEWTQGHIEGSKNIFVGHLQEQIADIPKDDPIAVICTVGHRSGLGASILLRKGYKEVYNVLGGMAAWNATGYPISIG